MKAKSRNLKTIIALSAMILFGFSARGQEKETTLKSPDGNLEITFRTEVVKPRGNAPETSALKYEVKFGGKPVIAPSAMGLELEGSGILGADVRIADNITASEGEDNYRLITGRNSAVKEKYKAVKIEIANRSDNGRKMFIEARAYNDAVAFRYIVPEQRGMTEFRLKSEKTEFRLPTDATAWAQMLPNYRSGYESEFHRMPVSALGNQGGVGSRHLVGLPLLMEMPGTGWVAISEADLEGNPAMYLMNPGAGWAGYRFDAMLSPSRTEPELTTVAPLPHKTAWRVIMAADNPGHFAQANTLTNLNPESRIDDTSWIKSGKSAWDWWNGSLNKEGKEAYTTETMKYYVDFAAEAGLEYMTVDAGWNTGDITQCREHLNVPEVVAYAKTKGVKVFIWLYSTHVWNQMAEAFPLYEKWGVAGMKIDFIERDDQAAIDWYYRVAELAAKHKLMVDFHGCTKPWGLQRTWPNVVGYEGIIGMEQSKAGRRDSPYNRLVIPFTRMIGGLADYTPGGFDNVTEEEFVARMERPMVRGTRAHHLAIYVVYESPFQMVADWPETYRKEAASFAFIKKVPASWDNTKVLNGYPGEYITIARKSGNDWYLGAMTDDARAYEITLDFLEPGNYSAEVYADAPDSGTSPKKISIKTVKVKAGGKFKIDMAKAGGVAVHFKRM